MNPGGRPCARSLILNSGILLALGLGCTQNLSGGYETVAIHPPEASFPFNRIEFDPAGKYTATGLYDGSGRMTDEVRTTTGEYRQTGGKLQIAPQKGDLQAYRLRRRLDGRLEILLDIPDRRESIRAILAPIK